jgi:hypothetical protein
MSDRRNCSICGHNATLHFERQVLGQHAARYFYCGHCGCIFAEEPYWLKEAYESALNVFDTGVAWRNLHLSNVLSTILYLHCDIDAKYLDYAAGYGLFVRLMRDIGFDYYWQDVYAPNLFARGFEHEEGTRYAAISVFELFEHLTDPMTNVARLAEMTDTLVVSTELWADQPPAADDWWYYGFEHAQHVMFYSRKTLEYIAFAFDYRLLSDNRFIHVLTRRPDAGGTVQRFVTTGKVSKAGLTERSQSRKNSLRYLVDVVFRRDVTPHEVGQLIRNQMKSRTMADNALMRKRFSEQLHAIGAH